MKLHNLHLTQTKDFLLHEELSPDQEEKLSYVQMMLARQGKDPDIIVRRIRGLVDPKFAKKEGAKTTLKNWLKDAKSGDAKDGLTYGRKIRITVLESVVRELVIEGFLKDIGSLVVQKLRGMIGGERKEHELLTKSLDTYPELAAIIRYAKRSTEPIYDDPKFWELVDKMSNGKSNVIKRVAHSVYERLSSESTSNGLNILTECVIEEAKISSVLSSLGLDSGMIDGLMRQYAIRDEDYDLSRIKSAYQATKEFPGKMADKASELANKAMEIPGKMASKAMEYPGKLVSKAKEAAASGNVTEENIDFAEEVIKVAYAMMQLDTANAKTPQDAENVLNKAIAPEQGISPEKEYEVSLANAQNL